MSAPTGSEPTPVGVAIGVVQYQLPTVETSEQVGEQAARICDRVRTIRADHPDLDLVVFPEYSLHGLSMATDDKLLCSVDGPEVAAFADVCRSERIWGCFSLLERNPGGKGWNTGIILDDTGELRLHYRKVHPWSAVEPWEPGDLGVPVCEGPAGAKLALIIGHDGLYPDLARTSASNGAEILLRTAGYTAPIRHSWHRTNRSNAFANLLVTVSASLAGTDGTNSSMGESMVVDYDGRPVATAGTSPDELVVAEVRIDQVREARRLWSGRERPLPSRRPRRQLDDGTSPAAAGARTRS